MTPEARQERQQKTIDIVDTYLECAGLQTYTQRGTLISELMNADDSARQFAHAIGALQKIESILCSAHVSKSSLTAARLVALEALTANIKKEK